MSVDAIGVRIHKVFSQIVADQLQLDKSLICRTFNGATGRARMRKRHWSAPSARRNFAPATRFFNLKVLLGFHLLCFSCSCQDVTPSTLRTPSASWPGSQRQSSSPHLISSIVSCHHPRDPWPCMSMSTIMWLFLRSASCVICRKKLEEDATREDKEES